VLLPLSFFLQGGSNCDDLLTQDGLCGLGFSGRSELSVAVLARLSRATALLKALENLFIGQETGREDRLADVLRVVLHSLKRLFDVNDLLSTRHLSAVVSTGPVLLEDWVNEGLGIFNDSFKISAASKRVERVICSSVTTQKLLVLARGLREATTA